MNEQDYKVDAMGILRALGWKTQHHEDMLVKFIPDVSFGFAGVDGWIEMKYADKTPRSLGSIPHYTHGQQDWLISRGSKGSGHCYLWVGTPLGHYVWRWSTLSKCRDLPWVEAVGQALSSTDLGDLCRTITAVVRHRGRY